MEIIDIGLTDLEPITLNFDEPSSSSRNYGSGSGGVNFGGGIELLMNDKKLSSSSSTSADLGDLDRLEAELNDLSSSANSGPKSGDSNTKSMSGLGGFGNMFGDIFSGSNSSNDKKINIDISEPTDSNLGQATSDSMGNTKTWDGFTKLGDVPTNSIKPPLSDREKRRKKRAMLQKLEDWYSKGQIKHSTQFTMESSYEEIEDEYETALEDKRKKDSVKLQQWWFMTFVNSLEYANSAFNPFDINLDGWGEQVSEDIESYEEIFNELHDKYKGGKMAPELSLLLRLGFSAAVVNFSNKALSSATPAFNDVIKQSPELMRMFTNATVNSMSQASPGFAFANNMMNEQGPTRNMGPPPAPQDPKNIPPPPRPGQMNQGQMNQGQMNQGQMNQGQMNQNQMNQGQMNQNQMNQGQMQNNISQMQFQERPGHPSFQNQQSERPDIAMARGSMFREQGVDINMNYDSVNQSKRPTTLPPMQQQSQRPEMRGPQNTDIDNILSGLKTKTVDIHQPSNQPIYDNADDSVISISSLKDMQGTAIPKKSRRKNNGSARNTISLDL